MYLKIPWHRSTTVALLLMGSAWPAILMAAAPCPSALLPLFEQVSDNGPVAADDDDETHGDYALPSQQLVDEFAAQLALGLDDDWSLVDVDDLTLGLQHCELTLDEGMIDVLFEPLALDAASSTGLPMIAIRRIRPTVPVVLGVPHAASEAGVVKQGVSTFLQSSAVSMLVIAPQDRCHLQALAPDAYQGNTSECGGVYRQSDAAHTQQSFFHAAHRAAWSKWPHAISLQIHGMSAAGISVSGGLTAPMDDFPAYPATAFHDRYAATLELMGYMPAELTTCSSYNGPRGNRVRVHLCGTRNAQRAGLAGLDRLRQFIHLEQAKPIRQDPLSATAIAIAVDAMAGTIWTDGFEVR